MSIWQQISKEFFSKLYPSDAETNTTTTIKASGKPISVSHKQKTNKDPNDSNDDDNSTEDDVSTDGKWN